LCLLSVAGRRATTALRERAVKVEAPVDQEPPSQPALETTAEPASVDVPQPSDDVVTHPKSSTAEKDEETLSPVEATDVENEPKGDVEDDQDPKDTEAKPDVETPREPSQEEL
jgi:hypothetical protein